MQALSLFLGEKKQVPLQRLHMLLLKRASTEQRSGTGQPASFNLHNRFS